MYKLIVIVFLALISASFIVAQGAEDTLSPSTTTSASSTLPSSPLSSISSSTASATLSESSSSPVSQSTNTASFLLEAQNSSSATPSNFVSASPTANATVPSASSSSNPASSPYSCYCDWHEIYALEKSVNGSAPGSLAYGAALSVSLNYLVVGSTLVNNSRGAVDIYTRFANFPYWTYRTTINANRPNPGNYYFGQFVSVLEDNSVVVVEVQPTPRIYSFERNAPNSWIQVMPSFALNFTRITAMVAYRSLLVVSYAARPGGVDIYTKGGYTWTKVARIVNPEGGAGQYIQLSIGAGNFFVAITTTGSIHSFTRTNAGVWSVQAMTGIDKTLTAVAASKDRAYIAASTGTSISLFPLIGNRTYSSTPFATFTEFNDAGYTNRFSAISTIQISGQYIVVADSNAAPASIPETTCTPSPSTGAVYVFTRAGSVITSQQAVRPRSLEDSFGRSLGFSNSQGNIIVVGGVYDTVYTFIEVGDVALAACPPTTGSTGPGDD